MMAVLVILLRKKRQLKTLHGALLPLKRS
jgi:hypothetical protein